MPILTLADVVSKVKPTTSAPQMCTNSEHTFWHYKSKHDITGTTTVTAIKGTTTGTGDTSTTSSTDDTPAGTSINVANIDPAIELVGTTNLVGTRALDESSIQTKEVVIGSINSDASTLQLLVLGNARSKVADAACSKI